MKPQQLAALLGVAPSTLRLWAGKEYAEFLSPNAAGMNGSHRSFSDRDARVLAWVALMRKQNLPIADIIATLHSAKANNWSNLPPLPGGIANEEPIAVVPREAVEERLHALQDRYEMQLQTLIKERDELHEQLEQTRRESAETIKILQHESTETIKALQHESAETIKALQQRIVEITAQEAELRGELKQYVIGNRRRSALTLVAVAVLVGVAITALVVLIALLALPR